GSGASAVLLRIRLDSGRVQDERLRPEVRELLLARLDEERLREERVVRVRGDDPDGDPVRRVGACERVDDVEGVPGLDVARDLVAQPLELLLRDRLVDLAPPDATLGLRLTD